MVQTVIILILKLLIKNKLQENGAILYQTIPIKERDTDHLKGMNICYFTRTKSKVHVNQASPLRWCRLKNPPLSQAW